MTMTVTLTTHATPPSVEVEVATVPVGTVSLSVLRLVEADILAALSVRGARDALIGAGALLMDWDAPTGVPITYRVTALSSDGTVLDRVDAVASAIADPGGSLGWLSDPLDARSAVAVQMMIGTDASRTYSAPGGFVWPAQSSLARAVMGTRRQPTYPLVVWVEGLSAGATLRNLFTTRLSLLWRPPSHLGLPAIIYGASPEVTEIPQGARPADATPTFKWLVDLTATRGPGRDMVRAAWTYADVIALGLTYRQLFTAWGLPVDSFGSYRDLLRGP